LERNSTNSTIYWCF